MGKRWNMEYLKPKPQTSLDLGQPESYIGEAINEPPIKAAEEDKPKQNEEQSDGK